MTNKAQSLDPDEEKPEYITAFCRNCTKRTKHIIVWRVLILRFAKCLVCGTEWKYKGG